MATCGRWEECNNGIDLGPATENIKHGTPEAQIHERRRKIYDG